MFKKIFIILAVILISAFSAVFTDRYLFPKLASTRLFQNYSFLRRTTENVTVINKTEQVFVKEESSILKLANSSVSSVVEVISYPDPQIKSDPRPEATYASGLIVTSDGLIMTHSSGVAENYSRYKILTYDGTSYDAEIRSIDPWSGLVFLKIQASNLPSVSFGNSSEIKSGEKVVAMGRSFSRSGLSFASGVVSDFDPTFNLAGKTLSSSEKMEGVFRTDMNLGKNYLGGPIVDYSGQVIGVTGSLQFDGEKVYYQIPSEKIKRVIDRVISGDIEKAPILGIYYVPLTKEYALSHQLETEKGALVFSPSGQAGLAILADSPAEKAGLLLGDVILKVEKEEISLEKSLSDILYGYEKEDEVELTILRNKQEMKVKVQL